MPSMLLKSDNMDKKVVDLIYDKQLEFTKAASRKVSLEKTVNKMIKDRYQEELKKMK